MGWQSELGIIGESWVIREREHAGLCVSRNSAEGLDLLLVVVVLHWEPSKWVSSWVSRSTQWEELLTGLALTYQ